MMGRRNMASHFVSIPYSSYRGQHCKWAWLRVCTYLQKLDCSHVLKLFLSTDKVEWIMERVTARKGSQDAIIYLGSAHHKSSWADVRHHVTSRDFTCNVTIVVPCFAVTLQLEAALLSPSLSRIYRAFELINIC